MQVKLEEFKFPRKLVYLILGIAVGVILVSIAFGIYL